ncbi:PAAR domain-containing protein [Variovorax humicola]|uniref:PAAR domain-containing protein n=1 Tax=Variovorax humicola TaxID=1769758 RepID=A0ABU8W262_9BURK
MQSRRIIRVGDPTDHEGVVITGDLKRLLMGKPIARKGDLVDCPRKYPDGRLHGVNPIIEGSDGYKLDGIPVALEGHRTECGCRLIGTGSASAPV